MEMDASQQSHATPHSPTRAVQCSKCHAVNSREAAARFCDQCGHQLRKRYRDKAFKHPSSKRTNTDIETHPEVDDQGSGIVVTTTSDGGWFWGQGEQLPSLTTSSTQPIHQKRLDPRNDDRSGSGNQTQLQKSPTNRHQQAQTAHAAIHDRQLELSRPLRRVHSFGESSSSLLPPITQAQRRQQAGWTVNAPPTLKMEADVKAVMPVKSAEASSSSSCALLWGQVLSEAIAEFESTSIILTAEIDSDERCMSVLAQRLHIEEASRSKYVVASGATQLQFKYQELEKKVRMNKEKLAMVQRRLEALTEQRKREEMGIGEPEQHTDVDKRSPVSVEEPPSNQEVERPALIEGESIAQPKKKKVKKKKERKQSTAISPTEQERVELAAIKIQRRFRVLRARRAFAAMVKRAYQRVYDAESKRYFYYNPRTKESQWEVPQTLVKAQQLEKQQLRHRRRRAASPRALNAAASRIQALYRRRAARIALRQMLQQVYEKVYDADSDSYYYYCRKTKTSSWEKPKLLRERDLESPTPTIKSNQSTFTQEDSSRTAAAVKIQVLYRNRATRLFLRDLAGGNIEKHFDEGVGAWYYYNHRTQQSFWEQPRHASLQAAMPTAT